MPIGVVPQLSLTATAYPAVQSPLRLAAEAVATSASSQLKFSKMTVLLPPMVRVCTPLCRGYLLAVAVPVAQSTSLRSHSPDLALYQLTAVYQYLHQCLLSVVEVVAAAVYL
jgi:hypothetical protein